MSKWRIGDWSLCPTLQHQMKGGGPSPPFLRPLEPSWSGPRLYLSFRMISLCRAYSLACPSHPGHQPRPSQYQVASASLQIGNWSPSDGITLEANYQLPKRARPDGCHLQFFPSSSVNCKIAKLPGAPSWYLGVAQTIWCRDTPLLFFILVSTQIWS